MAVPARPVEGAPVDVAWGGIIHDAVGSFDVQTGTITLAWSASALSGVVVVTFPRAFAAPPAVMVTPNGGPHWTAAVSAGPTASGFSAQGRRGDGSNQTASLTVNWIAYGPRA